MCINRTASSSSSSSSLLRVMTSPSKLVERIERTVQKVACGWNGCRKTNGATTTKTTDDVGGPDTPSCQITSTSTNLLCLDIRRYGIGLAVVDTIPSMKVAATTSSSSSSFRRRHDQHHRSTSSSRHQSRLSSSWGRTSKDDDNDYTGSSMAHQMILPIHTRKIQLDVIETISQIVQDHSIGGFLVHWPVEVDTGKVGAKCGRVLYTLQALHDAAKTTTTPSSQSFSSSPLFSPTRPICLWDMNHTIDETNRMDGWGRCTEFTRISSTPSSVYYASKERYFHYDDHHIKNNDCPIINGKQNKTKHYVDHQHHPHHHRQWMEPPIYLWDDFCMVHWPSSTSTTTSSSSEMTEHDVGSSLSTASAWGRGRPFMPNSRSRVVVMEDDDDECVIDNESSSQKGLPAPPVKHLFVDRQLRLAATA